MENKPKLGEIYWTPEICYTFYAVQLSWLDSELDHRLWERGLVFDTKEAAEEKALKMLER